MSFLSYAFLLLGVFLLPWIFDSRLVSAYIIPKEYVFGGVIMLVVLLFFLRSIGNKKISWCRTKLDWMLLVWLVTVSLSATFSHSIRDGFLGRGDYYYGSVLSLLVGVISYLVIVDHAASAKRWRGLLDVLVWSGGLLAIVFDVGTLFGLRPLSLFGANNTVDSTMSLFGLWLVIITVLVSGQMAQKGLPLWRTIIGVATFFFGVVAICLIGFPILFWVLFLQLV
jgi:hypothetical protein